MVTVQIPRHRVDGGRCGWLGGAGLVLTVQALAAQAVPVPADTVRLTLDAALHRATVAAPELRIAGAALRRADGELSEARAPLRNRLVPSLDASLSYQRLVQNQYDAIARRFATGPGPELAPDPLTTVFNARNALTIAVAATIVPFDGGVAAAEARAAQAMREQVRAGWQQAKAQLELDVTTTYHDAVLSRRVEAIAESTLAQAARVLAIAEASVAQGRAPAFEASRARAALEAQRPALALARTARELADMRLRQLTGASSAAVLVLADSLEAAPGDMAGQAEMPTAAGFALARRQELLGVAAADARLAAARRRQLPRLALTATHQRFAYPGSAGLGWTAFFPNTVLSAIVSVPVDLTGRAAGAIAAAAGALDERRERATLAVRRAEHAELAARRAASDAAEALRAACAGDAAAAQAFAIAEVRFAAGRSSALEAQDARLALATARLQRARAARDLQVALARLARLERLPLVEGA
ncbi:MAG: TolC family protein [Gemmatimonadales bacterium]|nr:TolC family protein [Gemmatimonadales bacterium]